MRYFSARRRIQEELQYLLKFLTEYFGTEIQTVVVYGSFLRWSFRKYNDVDVAIILRDSPEWRWSSSESFWDARDDSPYRQNFFQKLEQFLKELGASRPYDIKVFTTRDLVLLAEFQERVVHTRGNLAPSIRAGKVIFQRKENDMAEMKKKHRSFVEFLDRELPALGMTHWYRSNDDYGIGIDYHDIGKVVTVEHRFLFITWTSKRTITIASVIAEPDTPIHGGAEDTLRLRVKVREAIPTLQRLAEKFEDATFGLKAELMY
ncbi:MAG: hypothetical protein HYT43_00075 [Candidatus Taylorbacteria bacterium]|nr:hypothetical protein [Candidatus Taylorbacteria bacterium]